MRTKGLSCKFIADLCSNHNQNFERCLKLIDAAKDIGCWGVKIQLFKADKLYAPGFIPREIKNRELPEEWIPRLAKYCQAKKIKFGGTPFDIDAVKILSPHVDFLKISSFDLLRNDLIEACMRSDKYDLYDLILSTGMATDEEIKDSRQFINHVPYWIREERKSHMVYWPSHITYLHCVSNYPTYPKECNLYKINRMDSLMDIYSKDTDIGWSDHTSNINVIYEAYLRGAKIIEFHLDLNDKKGTEFKYGHCYTPEHIRGTIWEIQDEIKKSKTEFMNKKTIEAREWRADPEDGLRPMKSKRNRK